MNYVENIAKLFLERSGIALLDAADYVTIAEWEKEGIPLEVVIDCINRAFDDFAEEKNLAKPDSIELFQSQVKNCFADWLQKSSDGELILFD
jgi:hypothetical protein